MPVGDGSGAGTGTSSGTSRRTCQRGRPAGRADRIARYLPDEMRPSRGPTGRAWATSVPPLDREPVLAAQFIEVVVRTSANQVGLETTTGRSTTLGSKEVSVVVKGRKAHSLTGLLGTLRRPRQREQAPSPFLATSMTSLDDHQGWFTTSTLSAGS